MPFGLPFDLRDIHTLVWFLLSIPTLWLVGTLLFMMGCALADIPDVSFPRSLLVAGLSLLVCVPLGFFIYHQIDQRETDRMLAFGSMRQLGIAVATLTFWIVSAAIFRVMRAAPTIKAFLASAYELLLGTLLAALVVGVIFVVIAVNQIRHPPAPPEKANVTPPAAVSVERT